MLLCSNDIIGKYDFSIYVKDKREELAQKKMPASVGALLSNAVADDQQYIAA